MIEPLLDQAALRRLADRLDARGIVGDVYLFGGGTMVLAFSTRPATRDLDGRFAPDGPLRAEALEVAKELGLPGTWLNQQGVFYLPRHDEPDPTPVFDHPNLRVMRASDRHLLAMKAAPLAPPTPADHRGSYAVVHAQTSGEPQQKARPDVTDSGQHGTPRRPVRPVGDETVAAPPPAAVVEHVLEQFGLQLAKLHGGSNAGAYVAIPEGMVQVSMVARDPVGEQLDLYDVYGFEDDVTLEEDLEIQVFRWEYTLRSGMATELWPLLAPARGNAGPHWPRRANQRSVPFFLTGDFERDLYHLTKASGMTREELFEQAVFDWADGLELLDVVDGLWARRRLRARRGAEVVVGRDQLAPWYLGLGTTVVVAGESAQAACWTGYPPLDVRVGSPCAHPPTGGIWACVSHNRRLPYAGDIERHTSGTQGHALGWLCPDHGLEAPPAN